MSVTKVFVVFHLVFFPKKKKHNFNLEQKFCSIFSEQPAKYDFIKEENL